jgi:selenide,water dikinase
LSPGALDRALKGLQVQQIPEILVGFDQADDAGVYRLTDKLALVQTVDFFAPIIDDAFAFGQIAAANALSDIYAMGARPLTALSVVGFPEGEADPSVLRDIIEGGLDKLNECGVALLGGHSVKDEEIKFGYAVTGTVDPSRIRKNSGACDGDRVLLTKQLGTGLIATALKKDQADSAHVAGAIRSMLETNRKAAEIVSSFDVRTMTDISGFGLIGHAVEVARASNLTIELDHKRLPILIGAMEYSAKGHRAGGLKNNRDFFSPHLSWKGTIPEEYQDILFDPQTSGGLLIFVSEPGCAGLIDALGNEDIAVSEVGVARTPDGTCIHIF